MDYLDVLYIIVGFCVAFAVISAYLIYAYVQEERKVAAKMKLKKEFENLDPSTYAQEEAHYRTDTGKGGNKNSKNGKPGSVANGNAGGKAPGTAAGKVSGAPVVIRTEDGRLVTASRDDEHQHEEDWDETEDRNDGQPEEEERATVVIKRAKPAMRGLAGAALIRQAGRGRGIRNVPRATNGQFDTDDQEEYRPPERGGYQQQKTMRRAEKGSGGGGNGDDDVNFAVGGAVLAGAAVGVTAAAVGKKLSKTEKKKAKNKTEPMGISDWDDSQNQPRNVPVSHPDLYNDRGNDASKPKPITAVNPSAVFIAKPNHQDGLNENVPKFVGPPPTASGSPNTFQMIDEKQDNNEAPNKKRNRKEKKVAKLLIPVESSGDFDDYRSASQVPEPPPPARYNIPTALMKEDKQNIDVHYKARGGNLQPRTTILSGMEF